MWVVRVGYPMESLESCGREKAEKAKLRQLIMD